MLVGVHALFFSKHAEKVQAFLRDVLGLDSVDAGEGWPIFAGPPLDLAVHPTEGEFGQELYLIVNDVDDFVKEMNSRGLKTEPVADRGWGLVTQVEIADGEMLSVYEPRHPRPDH